MSSSTTPAPEPPGTPPPAGPSSSVDAPAPSGRRPRRRTVVLAVVAVALVAIVGGLAWLFSPQPLLPEATAALASTDRAAYARDDEGLTFVPLGPSAGGASARTGLILYPGAKVPAEAYAPLARAIAERGYTVVVVPMPLNFAIFDIGAADRVVAAHPEIERWAIGGHSLGGAMAAQYASDHAATVQGLALCGAYSAADLRSSALAVSSVYGSLDAAASKIEDSETLALLPADAAYERIEGGNHEQCGWYTDQPNDPPATISRQEQQDRIVAAWLEMLAAIASSG